jgi:hypothetical protein
MTWICGECGVKLRDAETRCPFCDVKELEFLKDELARLSDSSRARDTTVESRQGASPVIAVIRALGFIGNTHYCADCLHEFHFDRGQHDPNCAILAEIRADEEWWQEAERVSQARDTETNAGLT